MNRLYQLKQTLSHNLQVLREDEEICLVNYNSMDGLDEWIKDNFVEYIENKKLIYFYTIQPKSFHASKSKNLAHRLGNGEWLFNLDTDNFISHTSRKKLKNPKNDYYLWEMRPMRSDTTGRICLRKEHFYKIGGYDETFYPIGYQDMDLIKMLELNSIKCVRNKCNRNCFPIKNSREETIKYTNCELNWKEQCEANTEKSKNKKSNNFTFEKFTGLLNFSKLIEI